MSKRGSLLLLSDMKESALKILKYVEGHDYGTFVEDEKTVDAVVRNFEIIGEAANRLEEDFRLNTPQIHWNQIRGFRNRIVHEYFGIDDEIVWTIIEEDLEELYKVRLGTVSKSNSVLFKRSILCNYLMDSI